MTLDETGFRKCAILHTGNQFKTGLGMETDQFNYKIIAATVLGALGGFLLAGYLFRGEGQEKSLSHHLTTLSKILEQIEDLKSEEVESFKKRIEDLLTTIESTYVRH
jgi:hypothetical protein